MADVSDNYERMWDEFAEQKADAYLGDKYLPTNIVGLTGLAREHEIFRVLNLQNDDVLLDAGCASGRQVFEAAPFCKKAVGIDMGKQFIAKAKEFAAQHDIRNVEFIVGDGERMPFSDETFSKVICSEVIEHVLDYHAFLAELIRITKQNGTMVFTVPNWNSRGTLYQRIKNGFRPFPFTAITDFSMKGIREHGDCHVRQFTLKTFTAFLKEHGLAVEYVGGASFLDGPKIGPIMARTNRLRAVQLLCVGAENLIARIPIFKHLGRHIVVRVRRIA